MPGAEYQNQYLPLTPVTGRDWPDTDVVGKEIKNKLKFRKRKEGGGEKGEETLEHLRAP